MAKLKIVTEPNEILRKVSKDVTVFDARFCQLLDDMHDTLRGKGVGLAAVQVGVLYRACLVETDSGDVVELVNPVIIKQSGEKIGDEGCLSIENRHGLVARPTRVTVRAQDRAGRTFTCEFRGRDAVCACHEIDHLNGVLFVDKLVK